MKRKQRDVRKIAVRFFFWFNDKLNRIKLVPGQFVTLHSYETTDEGWRSEDVELSLQGRTIHMHWRNDGRDCDGRLTQYGHSICHVSARAKVRRRGWGMEKPPRERFPSWEDVESCQRDEYAERMGY